MPFDATIPVDGVRAGKAAVRANWQSIAAKIGPMPEDWSAYSIGEPVILNDAKTGVVPISLLDSDSSSHFKNRMARNVAPYVIEVSGSASLTSNAHIGNLLVCVNSSALTLTFEPNADPALGVTNGFFVTILRTGAGSVTIASSGMTLQHPNGHTKVTSNLFACVYADTVNNKLYFGGATEA